MTARKDITLREWEVIFMKSGSNKRYKKSIFADSYSGATDAFKQQNEGCVIYSCQKK